MADGHVAQNVNNVADAVFVRFPVVQALVKDRGAGRSGRCEHARRRSGRFGAPAHERRQRNVLDRHESGAEGGRVSEMEYFLYKE